MYLRGARLRGLPKNQPARPFKDGLDYFPLAVDIDQNDKFQILQAECGMDGFAIFIKLSMKIYKHSYYTPWNNREALIFAKKNSVDVNVVNNVIEVCFNENIFDKELFKKHNVLSSADIQENYFNACIRRKRAPYVSEYLLIDIEQHSNLVEVETPPVADDFNEVNVDINSTDDTESELNVDINSESDTNQENKTVSNYVTRKLNKTKLISFNLVCKCKDYFLEYHKKQHDWGSSEDQELRDLILYICNHKLLELTDDNQLLESFIELIDNLPDLWGGRKAYIGMISTSFNDIMHEFRHG